MARRKKEPPSVHRKAIASAASDLFAEKGIAAASMDEIAKAAGYSKATLYVYFKNKEEIIGLLVMESMKKLYSYVSDAMEKGKTTEARYENLCQGLARYQREYPLYFSLVLDRIRIPAEHVEYSEEEAETWEVGERINEKIKEFLTAGIAAGDLREDLPVMPTILAFWGMLSGLIQMSARKETYILDRTGLEQQEYQKYGFKMLYEAIRKK